MLGENKQRKCSGYLLACSRLSQLSGLKEPSPAPALPITQIRNLGMVPNGVIKGGSVCSIHFQDGFFTHIFGTSVLLGLSLHTASHPVGPLMMTYTPHSLVVFRCSDILLGGLGLSDHVPSDPDTSWKASHNLASEVTVGHLHCILWVKQITNTSQDSMGKVAKNL